MALLGHCLGVGVERPCLVCEFMEGASLDERLKRDPALTWQERHKVASDMARGLTFLHTKASPPVIHQDIKPANIMLGAAPLGGLVAKIVDFGISRIAPDLAPSRSNTHISTQTRAGTAIYMPLEYHMMGRVSTKTDTYAFGVVLLQLRVSLQLRVQLELEIAVDRGGHRAALVGRRGLLRESYMIAI